MLEVLALITVVVIGLATVFVAALVVLRVRGIPGRVVAGGALALSAVCVLSGLLVYHVSTTPPANQPAPLPVSVNLYTVVGSPPSTQRLLALHARDATVAWQHTENGYPARLAVASDVVYTAVVAPASAGWFVEATRANDGLVLWSTRLKAPASVPMGGVTHLVSGPVIADGHVYLYATYVTGVTKASEVDALDAATGAVLWRRPPAATFYQPSDTAHALDAGGGRVFAGSSDGSVTALDAREGATLWHTPPDPTPAYRSDTEPLYHDGVLYVYHPSLFGPLTALRVADGSALWRFPAGTGGIGIEGAPVFGPDDATIYAVATLAQETSTVNALAINTADQTVRWHHDLDTGGAGSPALADGVLYAGTDDALYALRAEDGHILWQVRPFESAGLLFPVVAHGVVFAVASNQLPVYTLCGLHCGIEELYALNSADGSIYWRYPLTYPGPVAVADGV